MTSDVVRLAKFDRAPANLLIREIAASGLAAALAGVLVGGIGGRLAMRVSALLNPSLSGAVSENGNRIGDITAEGTIALVLFGGLLSGRLAAVAWVLIRPWLPAGRWRRPAAAVAAIGVVGFFVVQADNFDFSLLKPAWIHVVMFTAIVGGAGSLTDWLDRRFVTRLRDSRAFTLPAVAVLMMGVPLALPTLGSFFLTDFCACQVSPRFTGVFLLGVFVASAVTWVWRWRGWIVPTRIVVMGRVASAGAVIAGLKYYGDQVLRIM